jgi:hypothetical protein
MLRLKDRPAAIFHSKNQKGNTHIYLNQGKATLGGI